MDIQSYINVARHTLFQHSCRLAVAQLDNVGIQLNEAFMTSLKLETPVYIF